MRRMLSAAVLWSAFYTNMAGATDPKVLKHVTVYHESGRFGGWPANHGVWVWGNEILVRLQRGVFPVERGE